MFLTNIVALSYDFSKKKMCRFQLKHVYVNNMCVGSHDFN